MTAQDIIKKFNLSPLPEEGGFFRVTYRASGTIPANALPNLGGDRQYSSCIYYLITPEQFSGLHAVKSAEIFHFYAGDPVQMVQIDTTGEVHKCILGSNLAMDQSPQVVVEPNIWQGTKLLSGGSWALLGCTVSPGFEFEDFINGTFDELSERFPQHKELIREYTHI